VSAGSTLAFGEARDGVRVYLATAGGGIDVPIVLGSRSTHVRSRLGGFAGRAVQPGDRLQSPGDGPVRLVTARRIAREQVPRYGHSHALRVVLGPQDNAFTKQGVETLLSSTYTVSNQSDRIGYRLQGPAVEHATSPDIVSDAVPPGAVQVAGDGMPIILLADRGTTGGYTKVATVISADLPRLAGCGR
jgi:antagonist of KipI